MANLNVDINNELMRRVKARAAILGLDIKDYVARILQIDIEKADTIIERERVSFPCPKCKTILIVNKNEDVADCPLCNEEIIVSQQEVIEYE